MAKIRHCKDCNLEYSRFGDRCLFCQNEFDRKQEKIKKVMLKRAMKDFGGALKKLSKT